MKYTSLFPYFGGKSKIAPIIWEKLGDIKNYIEPFLGSGAVYFNKTRDFTSILNDSSGLMVNLWRAIQRDHEAVASEASKLLGEHDLHACELEALAVREAICKRLEADIDYFDSKLAGRYLFGLCNKIGSFATTGGPWINHDGVLTDGRKLGDAGKGISRKLPHLGDAGTGISRELPHLGNAGMGISRKLPHLGNAGTGISRELPHLGDAGTGISRKLPHLGNAGMGISRGLQSCSREEYILEIMQHFVSCLERTRIACGDWKRILNSSSCTTAHGLTGVFLDPPYLVSGDLYADNGCFWDVIKWCKSKENDPLFRIVVAGYYGDKVCDMLSGWEVVRWKQRGGYGGAKNSALETLWCSPSCIKEKVETNLFLK